MSFKNERLEEFNNFIRFRKVAVIGLGVSNIPMLDYLHEQKAKVTVFDEKNIENISKEIMDKVTNYAFEFSLGERCFEKLKGFDVILRSPSCLPTKKELVEEEKKGALITSEVELLMKMSPCKIIGVTGSDGKTTTTSLINAILKEGKYNTFLGGNIGIPLFTKLPEIEPEDILILELSSFQLMQMDVSPDISVITNITPNHLNIHKDYTEYIEAKKNIFKNQTEKGVLILNFDNQITRECAKEAKGKVIYFSSKVKLDNGYVVDNDVVKKCEDGLRKHIIDGRITKLKGTHNYKNICAAVAATEKLVTLDMAVEALKQFNPVEHRLELIKEIDGVKWYNDSVSSSPTRTIAGLKSYDDNDEIILIAGGYDKNLDYKPLAKPIVEKVKSLILLGQTSNKIEIAVKEELKQQNKKMEIYKCTTLIETVNLAQKISKPGQIVLFSPASASFDLFKNFADRGNKFKKLVNEL